MEDAERRSVHYSFRVMGLSVEGIEELQSLTGDIPVHQGTHFKDVTVSVAAFSIEEEADFSWVRSFLKKHHIDEEHYGVYVSITTSRDEDGVTLPSHILALCRSAGGTVDFSFCSLPDGFPGVSP